MKKSQINDLIISPFIAISFCPDDLDEAF